VCDKGATATATLRNDGGSTGRFVMAQSRPNALALSATLVVAAGGEVRITARVHDSFNDTGPIRVDIANTATGVPNESSFTIDIVPC
jgi:hypothetical protein